MSNDDLEAATLPLIEQFKMLVRSAYEQGFVAGKRQTSDELHKQILSAFEAFEPRNDPQFAPRGHLADENIAASIVAARSARGTVEPKVLTALTSSVRGKSPREVALETGVPENSVRGMLNRLKGDKVVKIDDRWKLKEDSLPALAGNGNPDAANAGANPKIGGA